VVQYEHQHEPGCGGGSTAHLSEASFNEKRVSNA
jgi:hypothetical protein